MPSETVQRLRQQLRERFPTAHRSGGFPSAMTGQDVLPSAPEPPHAAWPLTPDAFPSGAISEISPAHPTCGLTLLLAALLAGEPDVSSRCPFVLIDARDRFDPASFSPEECARLLWLRCRETRQALQSADLLLRDGNLPFVLLDLSALPSRELRRIPSASWHRLRQLAEASEATLLVLTPVPLVPRAALRLTLDRAFTLHHLDLSRSELLAELRPTLTRRQSRSA